MDRGVLCRPATRPTHHALCVGIGAYPTSPLGQNPVNDARALGYALRGAGFNVSVLEDATLRQLVSSVNAFVNALHPGDTCLFSFSGHGTQAQDGSNYLIPVEGVDSDEHLEHFALKAGWARL